MATIPLDMDGMLVIRVFSTQHDNPHRGRPIVVYRYQCDYQSSRDIAAQWKRNNPSIEPADIRFEMGSVSIY